MKYTELDETIWTVEVDGRDFDAEDRERERIIEALPAEERTAYRIIRMLLARKGFENWWEPNAAGGMKADCNDEIFEQMKSIIAAEGRERVKSEGC